MSRYTGPRLKKVRALGTDLPGLTRKQARNPARPGQHGSARRRRPSEYALRLLEKQKLRFNYGLNERQLRRVVKDAKRSAMITGAKIIELLERRFDNVVFRAGFAQTIPQARQMVTHGHFLLNGRRHNIPSARVKVGDLINVRQRSEKHPKIVESLEIPALGPPSWLEIQPTNQTVRIRELPSQTPLDLDLQLVIEFYAGA